MKNDRLACFERLDEETWPRFDEILEQLETARRFATAERLEVWDAHTSINTDAAGRKVANSSTASRRSY